jgi:SHS2 domain-containing protein
MGKYQILEHTADKGLAVEADSLPDLFETAARGLFRLMIDPDRYPPTEQVAIELHAPDLESADGQVAERAAVPLRGASSAVQSGTSSIEVRETDGRWHLKAQAYYCPIEPQQLEWDGAPVKSVTYHGLRLERDSERWRLRVFVDV